MFCDKSETMKTSRLILVCITSVLLCVTNVGCKDESGVAAIESGVAAIQFVGELPSDIHYEDMIRRAEGGDGGAMFNLGLMYASARACPKTTEKPSCGGNRLWNRLPVMNSFIILSLRRLSIMKEFRC